jgi:hypothetical protein
MDNTSFIIVDCIHPIFNKEFDKESLQYIDIPTNEYNDEVFVFDVKEVRIKYFYSTKTLIKERMTDTTVIVLTDDNELLSKLEITEFIFIFFKDYTEKLKQYFPIEDIANRDKE